VIVESFTVGPLEENAYLVIDESRGVSVVVDPGDEGERLVRAIERSGAKLEAIWLTHAHFDHLGAVAAVKRAWDVPVHLHPLDEPLYRTAAWQAANFGLAIDEPPPVDRAIAEGEPLTVGSLSFDVMHAPGHAPGHVVIHGHGIALGGDVLFAGSIGRTDLPLSSPADMQRSLSRFASLPEETRILPGHGPETTIGAERRGNPFLNGIALVPLDRR
jgi:glyoxylase-like metal-dependent hydrolase (beta-lactamase superfamily II)